MVNALRQKVIVQPGGLIELRSPELPEGAIAEIIVFLELEQVQPAADELLPLQAGGLARLIGAARGGFASPAEVDEFVNQERDSWGF